MTERTSTKAKRPPGRLVLRLEDHQNSAESLDEEDSLYAETPTPVTPHHHCDKLKSNGKTPNADGNGSLIDVTTTPNSQKNPKKTSETPSHSKADASKRVKCPCGKSYKQSSYVICAKCKQHWHQKCCNLTGLTQNAIKKLELWQCPRCYTCPLLGKQPASFYAEMALMKHQINRLIETNSKSKDCDKSLNAEVAALKEQVSELVKISKDSEVKTNLCTEMEEYSNVLENVKKMNAESILGIETSLSDLNRQVSDIKSCITSLKQPFAQGDNTIQESLLSPRAPNTESPHVRKTKTPCSPYIKYEAGVISSETKEEVMELIGADSTTFKSIGEDSREVAYYGEHDYRYTGHTHEAKELPEALKKVLAALQTTLPPDTKSEFNSCLITRYRNGSNHIPLHRDDEPVIDPESIILTVSLGAQRSMTFENNDQSQKEELILEDGSVLISSRFAQDFWKHGIPQDDCNRERISLTFRNIAPYYINSTIILGDSNTSRINFGSGSGTLGSWVPGKRLKVGHIEAIPDATNIGPYRNIVIHTGVNSLNNQKFRRSHSYLLHCLEAKCKEIVDVYPRAKVHISMLLPSRSRDLNYHINEFNCGILDFTRQMKNVSVIDNSVFGNVLSNEHGRWDVSQGRPYTADILHLGRRGIRALAMNFKTSIMSRNRSQSRSRFNASNGSYRDALTRSNHRDGYQPPP